MSTFFNDWSEAAFTSIGIFWMAFWAFSLGYLISSLIQVLVTRARMQSTMGEAGPKAMALGTFFGFISSSCSFAALSSTRALFEKGAGLAPAMAFMLASTNLVIELGIVIAIFLSWQFVVGEYIGGLLLIIFAWGFIKATRRIPAVDQMIEAARDRLDSEDDSNDENQNWRQKVTSWEGWQQIGTRYVMKWRMVWKDVLIGFTVAGVISAFVPDTFFEALFIGSGGENAQGPDFWAILAQALIGPVAAFFTFIGSMGNIPLAALLFDHGVSYAGVMAFIFSDLVVFPVLRIHAEYYGWKMALYIMGMLLAGLVVVAVAMHYGFMVLDLLPETGSGESITDRDYFAMDYGFILNVVFLSMSAGLGWLWWQQRSSSKQSKQSNQSKLLKEKILQTLSVVAIVWISGGLLMKLLV